MQKDDSPYHALTREFEKHPPGDLGDACAEIARELSLRNVVRTPAERQRLALRCADLLWRMHHLFEHEEHAHDTVEERVRRGMPVSEAYEKWLEQQSRSTRYVALVRASEYVLGREEAHRWCMSWPNNEARQNRAQAAQESDEGLLTALRELDPIEKHKNHS
jgi:hypothetical protein